MAEDHEQRVLERDASLSEAQRRVSRRAEVVRDNDVWRVLLQAEQDAVRLGEVPGLHEFIARRGRPDLDSGVGVEVQPVRLD